MTPAEMWNSSYDWSISLVVFAALVTTAGLAYVHGYLRGMPTLFRVPIDTLTAIVGTVLYGQFRPHTMGWSLLLGCTIAGINYRIAGSMCQIGAVMSDRPDPNDPNDPTNGP